MKLRIAFLPVLALMALHGSSLAATGEEVITAQKCNRCHTATTTKKGPSYVSVAAKYKGNTNAPAMLFKGLKAGGKMGEEEEHKKLEVSDDEIRAVVALILATK